VVGATPAEPAAAQPAGDAGGSATRAALAQVRFALLGFGGALLLVALLLVSYELAAARVPQQRAALEELIRHQTGLEVRFNTLLLRWGWYGPEAVFQDVELGEPQGAGLLLRAPRLIVGLDLWRMVRSGHLEASRITLENPDIDLAAAMRSGAPSAAGMPVDGAAAGAHILARWRGGRITITGGTLRTALPGGARALTLGLRRAELRRVNADWSAEAQVALPQALGTSVHFSMQMRGDPAAAGIFNGSLSFEGRGLQFSGWRALAGTAAGGYLPLSGSSDFDAHAAFVDGRLRSATGKLAAQALAWPATSPAGAPLTLGQLRGTWQLARRGAQWHLGIEALELGTPAAPPASLLLDAAVDGSEVRARIQHAPLEALASLTRWYAPQLPFGAVVAGGDARELRLDWSARRTAGTRLAASAELEALTLASASGELVLSGLSGEMSGAEDSLSIELRSPAARLVLLREQPQALEGLEISARLAASTTAKGGWRLDAPDLQVARAGLRASGSATVGVTATGLPPTIDGHLLLKDSDIALLASLLGPRNLAPFGAAAPAVTAGHIESAELTWHGPLAGDPWSSPGARFTGSVSLRDATLSAGDGWPDAADLAARIDWHGAHFHAAIERARSGTFALREADAEWDARAGYPAHFSGRLEGEASQAIAWLQSHPQAAAWAPGLERIDLHGTTLLDLEVALPASAAAKAPPPRPRVRIAALLDGAQLRPVAGLPPLARLRGTLAFAAGQLQRSTLTGEWLGGPASLAVSERHEHGTSLLTIAGRGTVDARAAAQLAGANADSAGVSGSADWSALLLFPVATPAHWQLHADSSLAAVASRLPEPFAKVPGAVLPLHLDLQANDDRGELRVSLGDRFVGAAALARSGDSWRIERGALRLGGTAPPLPLEPLLVLDGRVSRLDFAACLALWRQAARDAALPQLRAHLTAAQLLAGTRSFPEVSVSGDAAGGAGVLRVESAALTGSARWGALIDAEHPALLHFSRFNITGAAEGTFTAQLAAVLAPAAQLAVDELAWQGRSLGTLAGTLAVHGTTLEARELALSGPAGDTRADARCYESLCTLEFRLETADAAAALSAFGFTQDVSASHAHLAGQLHWSPQDSNPLATLGGSLHMRLENGVTGAAVDAPRGTFALLSVPALLAGMAQEPAAAAPPALHFVRLTADYEVRDGQAVTPGLHFDGDAEILVRGRVGLSSGDYDEQAWILHGEDRLPAAVRRLGPSPRLAALWLSLRELLGGEVGERAQTALHLRGPWSDPIVTPLE